MTHEERFGRIEQQLEFLAGNHAQLWTDLQELQQISRRHSEQIEQHSAQIAEVGGFILRLGRVLEEQGRQTERRIEAEAQQRREEVRRRDEESRRIDERLNALIHIVERYFSNGPKGQP
jgi:septal ring factor EnvC (AmiA/AmiB activator)